jgi:hypothetical protein
MSDPTFKVEYVTDESEIYARLEVTRSGDSFAFLDFSTTSDEKLVVNFWWKDGGVQVPIEQMEEFIRWGKIYSAKVIANGKMIPPDE